MRFKKFISGLTSLALSLSAFAGAGLTRFADNTTANAAATDWKFDFGGGGTMIRAKATVSPAAFQMFPQAAAVRSVTL